MLRVSLLLLALLLAACQSPAPRPSEATDPGVIAAPLPAGTRYRVDTAASELLIHAFRGGRAPALGKNHVLEATDLAGEVVLPSDWLSDAAFALRFTVSALELDDPARREAIGEAFAAPLTQDQIEGTRRNLLSEAVLDASAHPTVELRSLAVAGDWPLAVARVAVRLRGAVAAVDVPMTVRRDGDRLVAEGQAALRQSDFDITPFSVLGGLLAVQDELLIRFRLTAQRDAP